MPPQIPGGKVTPPVTVLFIHSGNNWIRGSEQCLLDLVAHLDRSRFQPVVVCNQNTLANAAISLGADAEVIPSLAQSGVLAPSNVVKLLQETAQRYNAGIIHANSSIIVPTVVPVARRMRIPFVSHLHITPTADERRHELLHQSSTVVGVSKLAVEGFVDEGMRADRVRVIDNAVDGLRVASGDATALRESLGIARSSCVVGTLGSLIDRKGHDTAIRGVAHARRLNPDVDLQLLICGSGEDEVALKQLAATENVADRVYFLGFRSDAGAVLRDAIDLFVSPSRWEALPLNVLEAQWIGLPIIASDIPAHREALISETSSEIVPLDNAEALARAMVKFAQTDRYAIAARRTVSLLARDRFSMDRHVNAFEQLYSGLLRVPAKKYGWFSATTWPTVYTTWLSNIVRKRLRRTFNR